MNFVTQSGAGKRGRGRVSSEEEENSSEEELRGLVGEEGEAGAGRPRAGKKTRGRVKVKMEFIRSKVKTFTVSISINYSESGASVHHVQQAEDRDHEEGVRARHPDRHAGNSRHRR